MLIFMIASPTKAVNRKKTDCVFFHKTEPKKRNDLSRRRKTEGIAFIIKECAEAKKCPAAFAAEHFGDAEESRRGV